MTRRPERSIIHVLWSAGVGGVERLVVDLAAMQVELGESVRIAFAQAAGPFVEQAKHRGLPVVDLGLRSGFDILPRSMTRAARQLGQSDVVHLHGFNLPVAIAAMCSGRPIVYTEHGFTPLRRSDALGWVKLALKRRFLRNRVAAVAANSRFTADRIVEVLRISRSAVHVVHNGIDVDRIPLPIEPLEREKLTVACVTRLVAWKRLDRALRALSIAGRSDIRIVIVGDGPDRRRLEKYTAALGLADRVAFLGVRQDVAAVVGQADVLIQPSVAEWFGLSIIEGCAQGLLPVVFADAGGALEVLPPDGIVVRDVEELGSLLRGLRGQSLLGMTARRARAEWVRRAFPITRTAQGYADLYSFALRPLVPGLTDARPSADGG